MHYLTFIFVKLIRPDFTGLWLILQSFVDNVSSHAFDNSKSFKTLPNNPCGLFKAYVQFVKCSGIVILPITIFPRKFTKSCILH